jgi:hypothetical protein
LGLHGDDNRRNLISTAQQLTADFGLLGAA